MLWFATGYRAREREDAPLSIEIYNSEGKPSQQAQAASEPRTPVYTYGPLNKVQTVVVVVAGRGNGYSRP
jgi:hypothetical protein